VALHCGESPTVKNRRKDATIVGLWGRAAGLAWYAMGFMTLVMCGILLLVAQRLIPGLVVGEIAGWYFLAMGAAAGATQLPNMAERLPGSRRWDRSHDYDGPDPTTDPEERVTL